MKFIYPAIFHKEDGAYWVEFPDLEGCQSFGDTLEETMSNAREALEGHILTLFDERLKLNPPSDISAITLEDDAFVSLIDCDISKKLSKMCSVKKTLTIPKWLNDEAMERNINFSQVLQKALMEQLNTH